MKSNKLTKLLAVIVAVIMAATIVSPLSSRAATDYTDVAVGTNPTFKVTMVVPKDTSLPAVTFNYAIEPAEEKDDIKAGICVKDTDGKVTSPSIADVAFSPSDTKTPHATDNTLEVCEKDATVNFSGIEFPEPGVYRYKITETYSAPGVGTDASGQFRYLNVYVENDETVTAEDNLQVSICTISVEEAFDTNKTEKTEGYTHDYPTNTLDVSKMVTGNQGSKDKYFKFTITAAEVTGTAVIADNAELIVSGQDADPQKTPATTYEASDMKATNEKSSITGAEIKAGHTVYLQHGQTVTITGIPKGCTYTVTEESATGYTTSYTTKVGSAAASQAVSGNEATGTLDDSTVVAFTNEKKGTVPTGVLLSATGLIVVGLIVVVGVVFFGIRSKKRYEED